MSTQVFDCKPIQNANVRKPQGISRVIVPFAPATLLDSLIGVPRTTSQKYRQDFRKALRIKSDAGMVSIGRRGTIQLESSLILAFLVTAIRWDRATAMRLVNLFKEEGFEDLIRSRDYRSVLSMIAGKLKDYCLAEKEREENDGRGIRSVYSELNRSPELRPLLLKVAIEMSEIWSRVDQREEAIASTIGELVRIEGDTAIIVLESQARAREELRLVPTCLLSKWGIGTPGDSLLRVRLQWTPETVSTVYLPAFSRQPIDQQALMRIEKMLQSVETEDLL